MQVPPSRVTSLVQLLPGLPGSAYGSAFACALRQLERKNAMSPTQSMVAQAPLVLQRLRAYAARTHPDVCMAGIKAGIPPCC